MPGRLRGQIVAVLAGAALTVASGVWAHGGTRSTGYFSTFSSLEPHVLGVSVNVFGRDNTIRLSNYSGKTVIVFGRSNEPYLRFSSKRIEKKMRSPTTFLNSSHTVPAGAGRDARPRWRKVASGASYAWHDHRIVWTGTRPPLVIRRAPHVSHLVFRWRLPATAGGKRFVIAGFLGWPPPPRQSSGGGTNWLPIAGAAGGALLVLAAIGAGARRARRRAP